MSSTRTASVGEHLRVLPIHDVGVELSSIRFDPTRVIGVDVLQHENPVPERDAATVESQRLAVTARHPVQLDRLLTGERALYLPDHDGVESR